MARLNSKDPENISEALNVLQEAATDKAGDIKGMLGRDYDQFKRAVDDLKPYVGQFKDRVVDSANETTRSQYESARNYARKGYDAAQERAKQVDDQVHENPWKSMGIVALIVLFIGFLMGRKD